jgi:dihydrofolate reductase
VIVSLIAAMAQNRVIGHDGGLPWRLPRDMRRFQRLTTGHAVIMGRKTYDSVGQPLPNRRNLVVTRSIDYRPPGVRVFHSLDDALLAADCGEVFVAGGAEIYRLAFPRAVRLYLTVVHAVVEGDTFFPAFAMDDWHLEEDLRYPSDERHPFAHSFRFYVRRSNDASARR